MKFLKKKKLLKYIECGHIMNKFSLFPLSKWEYILKCKQHKIINPKQYKYLTHLAYMCYNVSTHIYKGLQ